MAKGMKQTGDQPDVTDQTPHSSQFEVVANMVASVDSRGEVTYAQQGWKIAWNRGGGRRLQYAGETMAFRPFESVYPPFEDEDAAKRAIARYVDDKRSGARAVLVPVSQQLIEVPLCAVPESLTMGVVTARLSPQESTALLSVQRACRSMNIETRSGTRVDSAAAAVKYLLQLVHAALPVE